LVPGSLKEIILFIALFIYLLECSICSQLESLYAVLAVWQFPHADEIGLVQIKWRGREASSATQYFAA
jgi:hypothetical protein